MSAKTIVFPPKVTCSYPWEGHFDPDEAIKAAAGRRTDHSGCGCGYRDLEWDCETEAAAAQLAKNLRQSFPDYLVTVKPERLYTYFSKTLQAG